MRQLNANMTEENMQSCLIQDKRRGKGKYNLWGPGIKSKEEFIHKMTLQIK